MLKNDVIISFFIFIGIKFVSVVRIIIDSPNYFINKIIAPYSLRNIA
jgi:hypothetical protein